MLAIIEADIEPLDNECVACQLIYSPDALAIYTIQLVTHLSNTVPLYHSQWHHQLNNTTTGSGSRGACLEFPSHQD